jgi:hypothetical protein
MKSTTRFRRRCACGKQFGDKRGNQSQCVTCRPPRDRELAPPLSEEERWRRWLLAELEPFHGLTVRVNDLILHLREQASKGRAA